MRTRRKKKAERKRKKERKGQKKEGHDSCSHGCYRKRLTVTTRKDKEQTGEREGKDTPGREERSMKNEM